MDKIRRAFFVRFDRLSVVALSCLLACSCDAPSLKEDTVSVANQSDQMSIADTLLADAATDEVSPKQTFCTTYRFLTAFERLQMDMAAMEEQGPSKRQWFQDKAANTAFEKLMVDARLSAWTKLGEVPFPDGKRRYELCPSDIAVPLDRDGLFYKYRTVSLSLPIQSGRFVFLERSYGCGPLCGSGELIALAKGKSGRWFVFERRGLWIS